MTHNLNSKPPATAALAFLEAKYSFLIAKDFFNSFPQNEEYLGMYIEENQYDSWNNFSDTLIENPDSLYFPENLKFVVEAYQYYLDRSCPPELRDNRVIVKFLCDSYMHQVEAGKSIKPEDYYRLRKDIAYFEALKKSQSLPMDQRDITKLSYIQLMDVVEPFRAKKAKKDFDRAARHITEDERAHINATTTILYNGAEGKILIPHSEESSIYWGNGTRWCIAASKANNAFITYNDYPILFFITNEHTKFALVDKKWWRANDTNTFETPAGLESLLSKFNEMKMTLADELLPDGKERNMFFGRRIIKNEYTIFRGCSRDLTNICINKDLPNLNKILPDFYKMIEGKCVSSLKKELLEAVIPLEPNFLSKVLELSPHTFSESMEEIEKLITSDEMMSYRKRLFEILLCHENGSKIFIEQIHLIKEFWGNENILNPEKLIDGILSTQLECKKDHNSPQPE